MRLLICTQVIDREHPVLGFVHRWIEAFSEQFESITVICLYEGAHALPQNVSVYSLGKERGAVSKLTYALRFWKLLKELRGTYDAVLVHMNTEYVFLGSAEWKRTKKRTALWHNHTHGGWKLDLAASRVDVMLHTSPYAASAGRKHSRIMPAGIDTGVFKPLAIARDADAIYFQGRISRSKRTHVLLEAVQNLAGKRVDIVGPVVEEAYAEELLKRFSGLFASGRANLLGPVPNADTPKLYAAHAVSVNLTAAGNYDKSVLESIACGTPAVVSSPAFKDLISDAFYFEEDDAHSLSQALERVFALPAEERDRLTEASREKVVSRHSLERLGRELRAVFET